MATSIMFFYCPLISYLGIEVFLFVLQVSRAILMSIVHVLKLGNFKISEMWSSACVLEPNLVYVAFNK